MNLFAWYRNGGCCALLICAALAAAQPLMAQSGTDTIQIKGTLRTDVVAIGGETTGIEMTVNDSRFELSGDSRFRELAERYAGQLVIASGTLESRIGVETGLRQIIHVNSLQVADRREPPVPCRREPSGNQSAGVTTLVVRVPTEASVFLLDQPTYLTGPVREFSTTKLKPGQRVDPYPVRVEVDQNGTMLTSRQEITLVGGRYHEVWTMLPEIPVVPHLPPNLVFSDGNFHFDWRIDAGPPQPGTVYSLCGYEVAGRPQKSSPIGPMGTELKVDETGTTATVDGAKFSFTKRSGLLEITYPDGTTATARYQVGDLLKIGFSDDPDRPPSSLNWSKQSGLARLYLFELLQGPAEGVAFPGQVLRHGPIDQILDSKLVLAKDIVAAFADASDLHLFKADGTYFSKSHRDLLDPPSGPQNGKERFGVDLPKITAAMRAGENSYFFDGNNFKGYAADKSQIAAGAIAGLPDGFVVNAAVNAGDNGIWLFGGEQCIRGKIGEAGVIELGGPPLKVNDVFADLQVWYARPIQAVAAY